MYFARVLAPALVLTAGVVLAQTPTPSASAAATTSSSVASPPPSSSAAAGRPATGYGFSSDAPRPKTPAQPRGKVVQATGPVATLPGFEMLADGASRFFVELTQSVPIEERKGKGNITYVLKGAHVTVHNNQNPLVTVHFNTPATSAKLVPVGKDLLFVIDLRAVVVPTWKLVAGKEGMQILQIELPKGSYLPGASSAASSDAK